MPIKPGKVVQVYGIQTAIRALERIRDTAVPTVREGLFMAANNILILAKYYCPKDTHALTNSGRVHVRDNLGEGTTSLRAWVSFGGKVGHEAPMGLGYPSAQQKWRKIAGYEPLHLQGQVVYYAVYVHENLTAHHDQPTQAKFLERAVRESFASVPEIIGAHLEQAIGRRLEVTASGEVKNFGRLKIPPPAGRPG